MMVSIKEKAKELGVSIATLRRWDRKGFFPQNCMGNGHIKIRKDCWK